MVPAKILGATGKASAWEVGKKLSKGEGPPGNWDIFLAPQTWISAVEGHRNELIKAGKWIYTLSASPILGLQFYIHSKTFLLERLGLTVPEDTFILLLQNKYLSNPFLDLPDGSPGFQLIWVILQGTKARDTAINVQGGPSSHVSCLCP